MFTRSIQRKPFQRAWSLGVFRIDSSFLLHSYFSDAPKPRDGRPLVKSIYIMLLSFSMDPHGKTSPLCPPHHAGVPHEYSPRTCHYRGFNCFIFANLPQRDIQADGYLKSSSPARDRSKEFSLRFRGQVYIMRESRKD